MQPVLLAAEGIEMTAAVLSIIAAIVSIVAGGVTIASAQRTNSSTSSSMYESFKVWCKTSEIAAGICVVFWFGGVVVITGFLIAYKEEISRVL